MKTGGDHPPLKGNEISLHCSSAGDISAGGSVTLPRDFGRFMDYRNENG